MYDKINKEKKDLKPPKVMFPSSLEDLDLIINELDQNNNVIINESNLNEKLRFRILDFVTGYAYAKNIKREKLDNWIYLFKF